jgi:bifunctional ADP-heptose synthase (sugar kinase/adenylyltransferase)
VPEFFTPTYTKPMERRADGSEAEMNRLDIKNRRPLPEAAEAEMRDCLQELATRVQGVIVSDQVQEEGCGVVSASMRSGLSRMALDNPKMDILVDSRTRIGLFHNVMLKPNQHEAVHAATGEFREQVTPEEAVLAGQGLSAHASKPVFLTRGAEGISVCTPEAVTPVPAIRLDGPLDIVGAGDSANAGIMMALCAGASLAEAAVVGNLVASITVQQLGTTGTAGPGQVRARFRQYAELYAEV